MKVSAFNELFPSCEEGRPSTLCMVGLTIIYWNLVWVFYLYFKYAVAHNWWMMALEYSLVWLNFWNLQITRKNCWQSSLHNALDYRRKELEAVKPPESDRQSMMMWLQDSIASYDLLKTQRPAHRF